MSGGCDKCGEYALECACKHDSEDLQSLIDPPAEVLPVVWIDVCGREEHEAIIKDDTRCNELGLDQDYEIMVYLKRWKGWLTKD